MGTMASQITSLTIVYSTVYSAANQRKHQSSASLAFVWGIHRGPVNSPHKGPVTRKMFPFDDVIMSSSIKQISKYSLKMLKSDRSLYFKCSFIWSAILFPLLCCCPPLIITSLYIIKIFITACEPQCKDICGTVMIKIRLYVYEIGKIDTLLGLLNKIAIKKNHQQYSQALVVQSGIINLSLGQGTKLSFRQ